MAVALIASLTVINAERSSGLHGNPGVGLQFSAPAGTYIPSEDTFRIRVTAIGEDGDDNGTIQGGEGATVSAVLNVTPGETLRVFVDEGGAIGGAGTPPAGNGRDGGGASGIERGSPANPLIVAAGGGGAGGTQALPPLPIGPGNGGNGGATGGSATGGCAPGASGSAGLLAPVATGQGGGGGGCSSGGTGGLVDGQDGALRTGGNGGPGSVLSAGGGGGGGGYYGGGGGGSGIALGGGGGGGGGSSFVMAGADNATFSGNGLAVPAVLIEEMVGNTECSDNVDNADPEDAAGPLADEDDPGCHSDADPADGDSSYTPSDNDETNPQCVDGFDNDTDGRIDDLDPGCHTDGVVGDDPANPDDRYNPADDNEVNPAAPGREGPPGDGTCSDGIDNDGDGLIDAVDPDCQGREGPPGTATCNDGIDNDGDGRIDGADPDCQGEGPGGAGGTSDLSVSQRANIPKARKGQTITFTVAITNGGPSTATNVVGAVQTSSNLQVVSVTTASGLCVTGTNSTNLGGCTFGSLAPGQTTAFSVIARVLNRRGRASSLATAHASQIDPDPTDNDVTTEVKIKRKKKKGRRR